MIYTIIKQKKNKWLQKPDCVVIDLIKYMREKGHLRDTQIEAIETYLYLKIEGNNKPLWELFSEGFFNEGTDLDKLDINKTARDYLAANTNALALFDFARQKTKGVSYLPELEKLIIKHPKNP